MPSRVCCSVAITILSLVACLPLLAAQESSQHGWYAPLTNGDGLRYPLEIGPLTWHVVGSGSLSGERLRRTDPSCVRAAGH